MKRTLIIGATSAIAQEIAVLCAERGERLYLLARNADKLAALVARLGPAVVGYAAADFADSSQAEDRLREATRVLGSIDSAFIVHGELGDQEATEQSFAEAERIFQINLLSVIAFVVPLANSFADARQGSLVVVSSVAGDRGRPRNYTYGAAKGALSLYLQGVRSRLYAHGVRVVTIRLGPVDTPMTVGHNKNALFAHAKDVAREIMVARERGPDDRYVPWFWRPIMAAVRNMPEQVFQRLRFLSGR